MYYTKKSINVPTKQVINQTRKYLVQQLISYGNEFMTNLKKNNILMYAIQDYGIHTTEGSKKIEPYIYMLLDVNGPQKYGHYINLHKGRVDFASSLEFFQKHSSYVTDYCYDSNKVGHLHVIVVKLPFIDKFNHFLNGKYSKMYSQHELDAWIVKNVIVKENKQTKTYLTDQYSVLTKNVNYFPMFKEQVLNEFGTIIEDNGDIEYDFPPHLYNEILRYKHDIF